MVAMETLLHQQRYLMAQISRAVINFKKLGQARWTRELTTTRLSCLTDTMDKAVKLHAELLCIASIEQQQSEQYFVEDEFQMCTDSYQEACDYFKGMLVSQTPAIHSATSVPLSTAALPSPHKTHLPKFKLPTFDGAIREWQSFSARFHSLIISDASLSNVDRLEYLLTAVSGKAREVIGEIPVNESNFKVAWDALTDQYDDKFRIVDDLLKQLTTLPSTNYRNPETLSNLRHKWKSVIASLANLGRAPEKCEDLAIYLATSRFDAATRREWRLDSYARESFPTYSDLDAFLRKHSKVGEEDKTEATFRSAVSKNVSAHLATSDAGGRMCQFCHARHILFNCSKFRSLSWNKRREFVQNNKLCHNCLSSSHSVNSCTSQYRCGRCNEKHNSLLHNMNKKPEPLVTDSNKTTSEISSGHTAAFAHPYEHVLLPTARVRVCSDNGRSMVVRALLDQGSEGTFVTERVVQSLRLPRIPHATRLHGVGDSRSVARAYTILSITPTDSNAPMHKARAIILRSLSRYRPRDLKACHAMPVFSNLQFADDLESSDAFDMIIGAAEYGKFLIPGLLHGSEHEPVAQNTVFGWILSGSCTSSAEVSSDLCSHNITLEDLQNDLRRFWELDQVPASIALSAENRACEEHFLNTHDRTSTGRYIVRLPFRDGFVEKLGASRGTAMRNLNRLTARLKTDPKKSEMYSEFLSEYEKMGHMSEILPTNPTNFFKPSPTNMTNRPSSSPISPPPPVPPDCSLDPTNNTNLLASVPTKMTNHPSSSPISPPPPVPPDCSLDPTNTTNLLSSAPTKYTNSPSPFPLSSPFTSTPAPLPILSSVPTNFSNFPTPHGKSVTKREDSTATEFKYYIPHHAVFRAGSRTTQLRVVFNASCETSTGVSLNDCLMPGQKLQIELPSIILRWRQLKYVLTADIAKMYRQILVDPRDRSYQRILWTDAQSGQPREYELNTVTYGMTSAPFLALRVMKQLAIDDGTRFPLAASVLNKQMYVDDIIFGSNSLTEAVATRDQLIDLLQGAGFQLHKWSSNSSELLNGLTPTLHTFAFEEEPTSTSSLKILGIGWRPLPDEFVYNVSLLPSFPSTKRAILSATARLFDPLGWLAPVIVRAKILLQDLWRLKCDWDQPIPSDLKNEWKKFYTGLPSLESISIRRWTEFSSSNEESQLHGFADASSKAYAACIYLRTLTVTGKPKISLLMALSRVAPIRTVSIPRLELCAAVLLVRLYTYVRTALACSEIPAYFWTDSTIVLSWLKKSPDTWSTFVANRVSKIQTDAVGVEWNHVPTEDNPADCCSRGLFPDEIHQFRLWWAGPEWLTCTRSSWPRSFDVTKDETLLEERRAASLHVNTVAIVNQWELQNRYSSWNKLLRVTAYVRRFIDRSRDAVRGRVVAASSSLLCPAEMERSRNFWLHRIQLESFPEEITSLRKNGAVGKSSRLSSLSPFLDSDGLIRVRGRLAHSALSYAEKHPIILKSHPLVSILIRDTHVRLMHGGPQITLAGIRQEFWLLRARQVVRSELHRCIICLRYSARPTPEFMGDLPPCRVTPTSRSFLHTGLDYAGPLYVRTAAGRGRASVKCYICLFVCMVTKAVHVELVSDCTTSAFLATFQRFIARRGTPSDVYSDNGTTFVGARNDLNNAYNCALKDPQFRDHPNIIGVRWHFIPPRSPHFGGLWEAGIKSVKRHLIRSVGEHKLTFEEMTTILCRIEAILNSRPISSLSDNLDDYQYLTPGHFLIGEALVSPPQKSCLNINENRLTRWQLVHRISESLWSHWRHDYLHSLQQRVKWRKQRNLAREGRMVILHDTLLPPGQWTLGRIVKCYPGHDDLPRVVDVKTATSICKRSVNSLSFLPDDISAHDDDVPGSTSPCIK